jgi:cephalosporin-C deacetylase
VSRKTIGVICLIGLPALVTVEADPVTIKPTSEGGHRVTAQTYTAEIDHQGTLVALRVGEHDFLTPPPAPARQEEPVEATVNVQGALVAVRRGPVRIEFTFHDAAIDIEHEGGAPAFHLHDAVTALVLTNGNTLDPSQATGDVAKIISGNAAIALGIPCHVTHRRVWPSKFARGAKREELTRYRIDCGVDFSAVDLVTVTRFDGVASSPRSAPDFAEGIAPQFDYVLKNLGEAPVQVELAFSIIDHYTSGNEVFTDLVSVRIDAASEHTGVLQAAITEPGFYILTMEVRHDGQTAKRERVDFTVNAAGYRPPLTRPDDFEAFWRDQLAALRAVPMDARVDRAADRDLATHEAYHVSFTFRDGERLTAAMLVPRAAGPHLIELAPFRLGGDPHQSLATPAQRRPDRMFIAAPMPEEGTFRRWISREDNNMLDCYLLWVRMLDFAAEREDVASIHLAGASRSGPLALVAAALAPHRVAAVHAHVPTSMGISWADKPYRGWGQPPAGQREMAAYFDPVNFAPDIGVPFVIDAGIVDNLSPPQGILAFYNHADAAPFKRIAVERGGHGYFTSGNAQRFLKELASHLDEAAGTEP